MIVPTFRAGRLATALLAAASCALLVPVTTVFATQAGDESGAITGTLDYTLPTPAIGAPCGPVAWTLNASGVSAAAAIVSGSTGGSDAFIFAGSTTVTATGTSPCATATSDLFGSVQLRITATGSAGLVSCSGGGAYIRAAVALVAELAMSCTLDGSPLPPAVVALAVAMVPTSTDLAHFTVAGAYTFGLSDITP